MSPDTSERVILITISRFRVTGTAVADFRSGAQTVLAALSAQQGYLAGSLARAVDDPDVWALVTRWATAGSYRRALGGYEVRMALMPLQALAIDEPGAYEVVAEGRDGSARTADTDMAADWAQDPGPIRRGR